MIFGLLKTIQKPVLDYGRIFISDFKWIILLFIELRQQKTLFREKKHKWHKLNGHADFLTHNRLVNQLRKRPTCIMIHNLWIIINDILTDLNPWIFFPKMTLTQFPIFLSSKNHDHLLMKKVWIFFPEMTLPDVPKIRFFGFWLDFFSKNDAPWCSRFLDFFSKIRR